MAVTINQYKDPYQTTSIYILESKTVFFVAHLVSILFLCFAHAFGFRKERLPGEKFWCGEKILLSNEQLRHVRNRRRTKRMRILLNVKSRLK